VRRLAVCAFDFQPSVEREASVEQRTRISRFEQKTRSSILGRVWKSVSLWHSPAIQHASMASGNRLWRGDLWQGNRVLSARAGGPTPRTVLEAGRVIGRVIVLNSPSDGVRVYMADEFYAANSA